MADPHSSRLLRGDDVRHLAVGAALLGSGGGGEPDTFVAILRRRLGEREIALLNPEELPGALAVPVGIVGGTSVLAEKVPGGSELVGAVSAVSYWSGRRADAVMGMEAGGLNAMTGLVAAVDLDLPYLDGDLMGRALPRLDQFSWATAGLSLVPMAVCQANGQILVVDEGTPEELERTVRTVVARLGGWAAVALPPTEVATAAHASTLGGVARALALGRAHAELPVKPSREEIGEALGGRVLGAGRVCNVDRHSRAASFGRGGITVVDEHDGTVLRVESENELLLAMADGEVVATCPDILCLLQARTALPLSVDRVQAGDDVVLVVLPGPEWWMTPERISAVAPRAFGLESPPVVGALAP